MSLCLRRLIRHAVVKLLCRFLLTKVLKQVHDGLSLSQEAISAMDSFPEDIFKRIAEETHRLVPYIKHWTIPS